MTMDGAALAALCKEHRLYQTPALNDRLYANFRGFTALGGLESYTGLRALFLEGNALESPAGLPPLPELRCLFLQQNGLTSLAPPTLAALPQLDTLNVGGNALRSLDGLQGCAALRTLVAADNALGDGAPLAPLAACAALESLDLSGNRLAEGPALLALLARLPSLKCLYLRGNPLVSSLPSYRKALIAALPRLTYLDDRPVGELERVSAETWAAGGVEAERAAREAHRARERDAERRRVAAIREIREAGWRKRREARGMAPEGGDPDLEGVSDEAALAEVEGAEEPEELCRARERLAAFTAGQQQEDGSAGDDDVPPALLEADVQAVLEESRVSRAELLAADAAPALAAENSCPNSSSAGGGCPALAAESTAPVSAAPIAVPEARHTVHLNGGSCWPGAAAQSAAAGGQAEGGDEGATCGSGAAKLPPDGSEDDLAALD